MRILLFILGILLGNSFTLRAQKPAVFEVNTWEVPVQIIPQNEQIRYPEFRKGIIYYTNGKYDIFPLNYSMLYGEMQFINPNGDTLSLTNDQEVRKVVIGKDEFYSLYGYGYAEIVAKHNFLKVGRKQNLQVIWGERLAGVQYSSQNTYHRQPNLRDLYYQKANGPLKIAKEVSYVLIDHNQRFYPAKKSVLYQLFPRHRKEIESYVKLNNIDFKQQDDLLQVVDFCSRLLVE